MEALTISFPQVRTTAEQFPSTILRLLRLEVPPGMPPANEEIVKLFNPKAVIMVMIDNFGLFEAVVYKPEALIKNLEVLALIETGDPYAVPLINSILRGPLDQQFHLMQYVKSRGKFTHVICREDDMNTFGFDSAYTVNPRDDMATYVESTKKVFRSELLFMHFLDFESLYAQYGHRTPPKTLLEKIVRRTDNWIKVLYRQARDDTLFMIIGNHGRHPIPLNYEGKLAEWRKANSPIAIVLQKRAQQTS